MTSNWGYSSDYYNPYYEDAAAMPYDYSEPVVVNNYVNADADAALAADPNAEPPAEDPAVQHATALFDEGLVLFKKGDYQSALNKFDAALTELPDDPVIHEVRAVTLFALGDYHQSAAALNSFLSSAPGMDWTTMSSLYGNAADYEVQLRKLEKYCVSEPNDAAAYFVLAYQYLVLGAKGQATDAHTRRGQEPAEGFDRQANARRRSPPSRRRPRLRSYHRASRGHSSCTGSGRR